MDQILKCTLKDGTTIAMSPVYYPIVPGNLFGMDIDPMRLVKAALDASPLIVACEVVPRS